MPKCPNCNHKHDFWDVDEMEITHRNTRPFIRIKGCTHNKEDSNGYVNLKETTVHGCPICYILFWEDRI